MSILAQIGPSAASLENVPHDVAVLAFPGISPFHLSVPTLVFTAEVDGRAPGDYRVTVCAVRPGSLPTRAGYDLAVGHGLEAFATADTVVVPSWDPDLAVPPELVDALRAAHARGARLVALCLGAFVLAATGLVDGREVTTHWHAADELAGRYPQVRVRSDVLWTDLGDVVSSAGTVAALDCCLHLVRTDLGASVAAETARRLVMAPHRDGSQAQYIRTPVPDDEGPDEIAEAMAAARRNLDRPLDLDTWAGGALMSRRTFTRRFRERTGESPGRWLLRQRLELARTLLETTRLPMDEVAARSGLGSSASLRRHFQDALGTSPRRHRDQFSAGGRRPTPGRP
jgi:transcriptional regulator GlxA family with amidase domain